MEPTPQPTPPMDPQQTFCLAWPMAKITLEALRQMAPGIPNIGFLVAMALGIVIAGGDAAYQTMCPLPQTQVADKAD